MKDPTLNSSSQPSTLSNLRRLYVVTGKGGVGKTVVAMALAKHLESQGKKVLYNSFDQPINQTLAKELHLPHFELHVEESAKQYVGNKLGNQTIAGWVIKTPFFNSLFNMLPGLGQMILLGNIINMLEKDPDLTIILDSPSSGHAITMLEASHNFKEMFRSGLIVEDINRMHKFIYDPSILKTLIVTLPTLMAVQEAKELAEHFNKLDIPLIDILANDLLGENEELKSVERSQLPEFMQKKIAIEEQALEEGKDFIAHRIEHFSSQSTAAVIRHLMPLMGGVL